MTKIGKGFYLKFYFFLTNKISKIGIAQMLLYSGNWSIDSQLLVVATNNKFDDVELTILASLEMSYETANIRTYLQPTNVSVAPQLKLIEIMNDKSGIRRLTTVKATRNSSSLGKANLLDQSLSESMLILQDLDGPRNSFV